MRTVRDNWRKSYENNPIAWWISVLSLGIMLRYFAMSIGYNYDFESYCIVGKLAEQLQNVYAKTNRYNYGPIFAVLQGICYKISTVSHYPFMTFRVLIVSLLTIGDLGISYVLFKKFSAEYAMVFFLNPVSIIITGFHNQFDNLAILLALLAICFYNEDKEWNKKDILFCILMSASLIMKHILFIFPFWILVSATLPRIKKWVYACVPPTAFLLSFVPFIIGNKEAMQGIMNHVFLYRSYNNAPLLLGIYQALKVPDSGFIVIFAIIMCFCGWYVRKQDITYRLMFYLLCLVAFSSAITNQYLAIPMVGLCVLSRKIKYVYMTVIGYFLMMHYAGFAWKIPGYSIASTYGQDWGYRTATVILFIIICQQLYQVYKRKS